MQERFKQLRYLLWFWMYMVSQGDYLVWGKGRWYWMPNPLFEDWNSPWDIRLLTEHPGFGGCDDA